MNYKKVSTLLKTINLEIEELMADLETKTIPDFKSHKDQTADLADKWMAEESVYRQAQNHNIKLKRLNRLIKNKTELLNMSFEKKCTVCSETISSERLRAKPSASRCITCQINYETSQSTLSPIRGFA